MALGQLAKQNVGSKISTCNKKIKIKICFQNKLNGSRFLQTIPGKGVFLWKTQQEQQQRPNIRKTHKEIDKAAGNSIVVRKHTNQNFICISMLYP